jgi:hypothetical protein
MSGGSLLATAKDAEILTLCHEVASGPSSAARGPQYRSAAGGVTSRARRPCTATTSPGPQPRASTRLYPAVDLHLARLQQLLCVHAMLGEARKLEELADPNRVHGDRDVEYRGAGHLAILPEPKARTCECRTVLAAIDLLRRRGNKLGTIHRLPSTDVSDVREAAPDTRQRPVPSDDVGRSTPSSGGTLPYNGHPHRSRRLIAKLITLGEHEQARPLAENVIAYG